MSAVEWARYFDEKKQKSEEASSRAQMLKDELEVSATKAKKAKAEGSAIDILSGQLKEANTKLQQMQGNSTKQFANEYIAAEDVEGMSANLDRWVANETDDGLKALGIKNRDTVSLLSGPKDVQLLKGYMAKTYGVEADMPEEQWQAVIDSGMFVKADGKIQDMSVFTKLSGAHKSMTKAQREVFDRKEESIVSMFNQAQADAEIQAKVEEKKQSARVNELAAQITGKAQTPDRRSTMGKELDDLAEKFPDLSSDELIDKWRESKTSTSGSGTLPWDERLIKRKQDELKSRGLKAGDKEYDTELTNLFKDIETKTLYGAAENRAQQDENVASASVSMGNTILDNVKPDGTYPTGSLALETQLKNSPVFNKDIKPLMKEFDNDELALREAYKVKSDLNEFIEGGGDMGKLESVWKDLSAVTPDDLAGMATLTTDELQKRYEIDGGQAVLVGKIVKSLYGSAASNIEGQTIRDHLAITSWSNATSAKAKVNSLVGLADRQLVEKGNKLISKGMTYSIPNSLNDIAKLRSGGKGKSDKLEKYKKFYNSLSAEDKAKYKNPKDL